ncbi:MAG: RNase adapter RapZ [Atribacterota bacterium]|nr:RNase adapter RapZ [Atribacterota bacterium]MDD5636592.1 RNase adapter RapZ [Atribacterota bacterium]
MKSFRLVIISGLSGAGKSVAIKVFEDMNFFCVDNIPPQLIPKFSELCLKSQGKLSKIAFVIDIRGEIFLRELEQSLRELETMNIFPEILFLEARDEIIVRRFGETRRKHPLQISHSILDNIQEERKKLNDLKSRASIIIDTSNLDPKQLNREIRKYFQKEAVGKIQINLISFGYKYGLPIDVDLVLDARFLPNPFYDSKLSELSGKDEKVKEYLLQFPISLQSIQQFFSLIDFLIPYYIKEGKNYLSIAIGCTGGRHRSVFLVNELIHRLRSKGYPVFVRHRDIRKEEKIFKEKF